MTAPVFLGDRPAYQRLVPNYGSVLSWGLGGTPRKMKTGRGHLGWRQALLTAPATASEAFLLLRCATEQSEKLGGGGLQLPEEMSY